LNTWRSSIIASGFTRTWATSHRRNMRSSNNGRRPDGRFKPERGKSFARRGPWLRFRRAGGVWIPPRNRDAGAIQGVHKIGGTPLDAIDVESNHYAVIGFSSFNGPVNSIEGVREVCRRTGATLVLVASKYTETR